MAIETIRAAKRCGADAIKFQTYSPDTMTIESDKDCFKINNGSLWDGYTYYELYKEAQTPWEWHDELFKVAREEGLIFFHLHLMRVPSTFYSNSIHLHTK